MSPNVLIVSNLDAELPFGPFTRPLRLGNGLERRGWSVFHVAVQADDRSCGAHRHRSTSEASVSAFAREIRAAVAAWQPDVIYCHQNLPSFAALRAVPGLRRRIVVDFHSLPSMEWAEAAAVTTSRTARGRAIANIAKTVPIEAVIGHASRRVVAAGDEVRDDVNRRYRLRWPAVSVPNGVLLRAVEHLDAPLWKPTLPVNVVATIPRDTSPANAAALDLLELVAAHLEPFGVGVHVVGSSRRSTHESTLRFHGVVPAVEPWLMAADACLLPYPSRPALAGGARTKLLEGLAYAQLVVTTAEGLRGFREAAGWPGVFVAADDTVEALAAAVLEATRATEKLPGPGSDRVHRLTWDERSARLDVLFRQIARRSDPVESFPTGSSVR